MDITIEFMRKISKYVLMLVVLVMTSILATGCFRQDMLMFEDGEFDGVEFSDYDIMHNAELDMDDVDRDWGRPLAFRLANNPIFNNLKIINRAGRSDP